MTAPPASNSAPTTPTVPASPPVTGSVGELAAGEFGGTADAEAEANGLGDSDPLTDDGDTAGDGDAEVLADGLGAQCGCP